MSVGVELEEMIIAAIERCCTTDEKTKKVLKYFENVLVTDLIEESQDIE